MSTKKFLERYGSWAMVTGASSGIGRACAVELAERGFNLVLVARRIEILESLRADLEEKYAIRVKPLGADLGTAEGNASVLNETESLDIGLYVAAAGFGTSGPFVDTPLSQELAMIDLNCRSVAEHTHVFANRFKNRGCGGIILFSSLVGFQGTPCAANYAATKAYIQVLAEGLRAEMKKYGVDVLAVAPGPVNTEFGERAGMQMGEADTPDAVAKAAVAALGRKATVRPGFLGKLLGYSLCITPRPIRVLIMEKVMGGMTRAQE